MSFGLGRLGSGFGTLGANASGVGGGTGVPGTIDTADKRRSAAGIPFLPLTPSPTPDATPGAEWRAEVGWNYSGIPFDVGDTRLPAGARVAFIGDSIFQRGHIGQSSGLRIDSHLRGEMVYAQALDPRFNVDTWPDATQTDPVATPRYVQGANQGFSGDTSADGLGRIATTVAMAPDVCVIALGTNSPAATTTWQNIRDIVLALQAVGTTCVVCNIRPEGTVSAPQKSVSNEIEANVWTMPGVVPCDLWAAYEDPGLGVAKAGYLVDGLHPEAYGAYYGALAINTVLDTLIQPGNVYLNLWNGAGTNHWPNPTMTGAGGASTQPLEITGTICDLTNISQALGAYVSTAVCSLVANADTGGQSQVMVITPSGSGTLEVIRMVPNPVTITGLTGLASKWVKAFVEVELDGWAFFNAPELVLFESPTTTIRGTGALGLGASKFIPPVAQTLWVGTPPFLLDASTTGLVVQFNQNFVPNGASGTGTVTVKRRGIFEVSNPLPDWGF